MATLTLEIVTPEGAAYHAECSHAVLPSLSGEIDVLPGHRPLVAMLKAGDVLVGNPGVGTVKGKPTDGPAPEHVAIDKGFARIEGGVISVLTEAAVDVDSIDLTAVEAARERAEAALKEAKAEGLDPAEIERLESVARFSVVQQIARARNRGQR